MTSERQEHQDVLDEAAELFDERDAIHHGAWKADGAQGSLEHIRHKLTRLRQLNRGGDDRMNREQEDQFCEDALDLINYAVFAIRNVRDGRILTPDL